MLRFAILALLSVSLFHAYTNVRDASASHTDLFIPVFEIEPESPITGQSVAFKIVITNLRSNDVTNATISIALDGVWQIDDLHANVPAKKSIQVSFTSTLGVSGGQHQLKACPERKVLGDSGDQCKTIDFVAIDASTVAVIILAPKEEDVLKGNATIRVATLGKEAQKVELYIDDSLANTKTEAPFDFAIDTTKYKDGRYKVYAIAYYDSGPSRPSAVKKYLIDNSESVILKIKAEEIMQGEAALGKRIVIASDVTSKTLNNTSLKLAVTFIVLIRDENGYTASLSWLEDKIGYGETIPMSVAWIPEARGRYTVETFLWDTVANAVPLEDPMKGKITVR
jgi:hypothetical protein